MAAPSLCDAQRYARSSPWQFAGKRHLARKSLGQRGIKAGDLQNPDRPYLASSHRCLTKLRACLSRSGGTSGPESDPFDVVCSGELERRRSAIDSCPPCERPSPPTSATDESTTVGQTRLSSPCVIPSGGGWVLGPSIAYDLVPVLYVLRRSSRPAPSNGGGLLALARKRARLLWPRQGQSQPNCG